MKVKTTHIFVILAMSGVALFSILFFVKNSSVSLGLPMPTGKNTDAAHPHPHTRAQGDSPTKRARMVSEDENVHGDAALTKATEDKTPVAHTPPVEGIYQSFKTALDLNKRFSIPPRHQNVSTMPCRFWNDTGLKMDSTV